MPAGALTAWLRQTGGLLLAEGRNIATALLIVCACLAAAMASAQGGRVQDWVPEALAMPEDVEVISEREVGSTVRMFSITTGEDAVALLDRWEAALRDTGYAVDQRRGEVLENAVEFSGPGIANAKIVVVPMADDSSRSRIEVDATLE